MKKDIGAIVSSAAFSCLRSWTDSADSFLPGLQWQVTEDENQLMELMAEFRRQDAAQSTFEAAQVTFDAYAAVRKNLLHNAERFEANAKLYEKEAMRLRQLAKDLPEVENG